MPRKNSLKKYQVITAGSMAGNLTSAVTGIEFMDNIGYQANITGDGSAVGTLAVQVSIDHDQDSQGVVTVAGNWQTITTSAVSGNGVAVFDLNQLSAPWLRLIYTRTSGTGTLNAFIAGKEV